MQNPIWRRSVNLLPAETALWLLSVPTAREVLLNNNATIRSRMPRSWARLAWTDAELQGLAREWPTVNLWTPMGVDNHDFCLKAFDLHPNSLMDADLEAVLHVCKQRGSLVLRYLPHHLCSDGAAVLMIDKAVNRQIDLRFAYPCGQRAARELLVQERARRDALSATIRASEDRLHAAVTNAYADSAAAAAAAAACVVGTTVADQ